MLERVLIGLLCLLLAQGAIASAKKEESEAPARGFEYVELKPSLTVNFGTSGRVAFLKCDVSLRVKSEALESVQRNMPAVRHELIMLLSRQTERSLGPVEAREKVRLEALAAVQKVIKEIDEVEGVEDLLFTSFLLQR